MYTSELASTKESSDIIINIIESTNERANLRHVIYSPTQLNTDGGICF